MLANLTIDSAQSKAFRRSVEDMVRAQRASEAAQILRDMLTELCLPRPDGAPAPLPESFVQTPASAIVFTGWSSLAEHIAQLDACGEPVSALSLELAPEQIEDEDGEPALATRFFFDTAWPFSECTYGELLEGYNDFGSAWHNDHADTEERVVRASGLAPLVATLAKLDAINAQTPEAHTIQAQLLGTLYVGVLFHIALADMVERHPLPRPMALLAASESPLAGLAAPVIAACTDAAPAFGQPAAIPLAFSSSYEEHASEDPRSHLPSAPRELPLASAPGDEDFEVMPPLPPAAMDDILAQDDLHLPPPGIHTTGRELRRRFVTEESIQELAEDGRKGFFARLFRRR